MAEAAFSSFRAKDYAAAIRQFEALLTGDATTLVNKAFCYLKLRLYRKAFLDCKRALQLNPTNERAFLLKGQVQWAVGEKAQAKKTWEQGIKICKDLPLYSEFLDCIANGPTPSSAQTGPLNKTTPLPKPTQKPSPAPKSTSDVLADLSKSEHLEVLTQAAVKQVQYGVGDAIVDRQIALGYYHINSGAIAQGKKVFDQLLRNHPTVVAAYLGRGTGHALEANYEAAITDFSSAIKCDPKCADAYKRRGQTLAALGDINRSLQDFDKAVELSPDADGFRQRGLVYYRKKNFKKALANFQKSSQLEHSDAATWNHMGLCYDSLGDCQQSIDCHQKAISMDRNFKEAYVNLGQAYKDWGKYPEALKSFNQALSFDPQYGHALHLRGITQHAVGKHYEAQLDLELGFRYTHERDCAFMDAITKAALGMFVPALKAFEIVLNMDPKNPCWYQREMALWTHHRLDLPFASFNADAELEPEFKEYFCKRHPPQMLKKYKPQPSYNKSIPDVAYSPKPPSEAAEKIIKYSAIYGAMLHNSAPGYLPNERQQRMAGLAAVDVAQRLRSFWFHGKTQVSGEANSLHRKSHTFGWRDFLDVTIRWRQISEPNDPVWWVDILTKEQFAEGFGSHTPMITGQCNVVRYSPMVAMSFPIMKREIIAQKNLSENLKAKVNAAADVHELYQIMRRDFWVVTPCHSLRTGSIMEGTRLTLQYSDPDGYEFSIRTPGTPPRWIDYDNELTYIFGLLTTQVQTSPFDLEKVSELILTFVFYWYNFMPLSRGTAACGLITLVSMFLAVGIKISKNVPEKLLLDWEAILRPTPQDYINTIKPWLYPARVFIDVDDFEKLPSAETTLDTLRKIIESLNCSVSA